jgi:hypothetical protein
MNEEQQPERNKTCLDAGQLIAWRDGALSPREAEEVMAHLAICARCAAEDRALMRDRRQVFDLLSTLDPSLGTCAEIAAALARFQGRLTRYSSGSVMRYDDEDLLQDEFPLTESEKYHSSVIPMKSSTRTHRIGALAQTLAAVLVVAALLGASLLLFRHRLPPTATRPANTPSIGLASASPIGPIGKTITVHTAAHGLEMTMQITPGPYFLSEMLAVNLSLTNHTNTKFLLQGPSNAPGTSNDSCRPPLKIVMTGGERPYDPNLQSALAATISCYDSPGTVQLQPAQTVTNYQYIALISSGSVTLTARATFQKPALQDGVIQIVPTASPLDGHWPSLQITVQTGVPSDRAISLHQQSTQVIVDAPPAARRQLIYLSVFDCDLGKGSHQHGGTDRWIGLQMMAIQKPQCGTSMSNGTPIPGKFLRWTYVVGAPGYAMVSGTYPT